MGMGSLMNLVGKAVGIGMKHGPKIGKTLGSIASGGKKFGQVIQAGKQFGMTANQISGGKLAQSNFGKGAENLINKAESATEKITSMAGKGENISNQAIERLSKY
jgi:hypothetical protein